MTKDDIIKMARDADHYANATHAQWIGHETLNPEWTVCRDEHFANLVAASEREACAKAVENTSWSNWFQSDCAFAIRERSHS